MSKFGQSIDRNTPTIYSHSIQEESYLLPISSNDMSSHNNNSGRLNRSYHDAYSSSLKATSPIQMSSSFNPNRSMLSPNHSTTSRHQPPMGMLYMSSYEDHSGKVESGEEYFEDASASCEDQGDYSDEGDGILEFTNPAFNSPSYYEQPYYYGNNNYETGSAAHQSESLKSSKTSNYSTKWSIFSCCRKLPTVKSEESLSLYKKDAPLWRLFLVTICFCALQCCWSLQIAQLTPHILEMNFPKIWITIVWLCGPLSGIIVQPVVGILSDRCRSRFGRRRPFILIGAILIIVSLVFIPNCLDIGYYFGDTPDYSPWALALTIIGFWILDIANNTLQGPIRALVADIAANKRQDTANSLFTFWIGIGNILGYVSGVVDFSQFIPMYATPNCHKACINLKISFYFTVVIVAVCSTITLVFAKEQSLESLEQTIRLRHEEDGTKEEEYYLLTNKRKKRASCPYNILNFLKSIGSFIYNLPRTMKVICIYQFFSWFAWYAFLVFITDWMGESVFNGNPDPQDPAYHLYEKGVRYGSFGLAGFSLVSLLTSPFIPRFSKKYGSKVLLFIAQIILSILLLLTFFVKNRYWAIVLISLFGLPYSITNTLPFTLCSNIANDFNKGTYMGILNIFIVVPQLMMSLLNPLVIFVFEGDVVATLVSGSIASLFASVLVWFITLPKGKKKRRRPRK